MILFVDQVVCECGAVFTVCSELWCSMLFNSCFPALLCYLSLESYCCMLNLTQVLLYWCHNDVTVCQTDSAVWCAELAIDTFCIAQVAPKRITAVINCVANKLRSKSAYAAKHSDRLCTCCRVLMHVALTAPPAEECIMQPANPPHNLHW